MVDLTRFFKDRKPDKTEKKVQYLYGDPARYITQVTWLKWSVTAAAGSLSAAFTYSFAQDILQYIPAAIVTAVVVDVTKLIIMHTSNKRRGNKQLTSAALVTIVISCGFTMGYFVNDTVQYHFTAESFRSSRDLWIKQETTLKENVDNYKKALDALPDPGNERQQLITMKQELLRYMNGNSNAMAYGGKQERDVYGSANTDLSDQIRRIDQQLAVMAQDNTDIAIRDTATQNYKDAVAEYNAHMDSRPMMPETASHTGQLAQALAEVAGVDIIVLSLGLSVLIAALIEASLWVSGRVLESEASAARTEIAARAAMLQHYGKDAQDWDYYIMHKTDEGWTYVLPAGSSTVEPSAPAEPVVIDPDADYRPVTHAGTILDALKRQPDMGLYTYSQVKDKLVRGRPMTVPFGWDADGNVCYVNIAALPHLLIAGTTGSGKTAFTQTVVTALCDNARPEEVELSIIDPKKVDFVKFRKSPLLKEGRILVELEEAVPCITEAAAEMDRRYELMMDAEVTSLAEYNQQAAVKLPYRVILVDEFADLLDEARAHSKDLRARLEDSLTRIAQKARAAGIHLILSTQRPDAKVVEGRLKSNMVAIACFRTINHVNSNVILGQRGAESLAGKGDMLYIDNMGIVRRLQGFLCTPEEMGAAVHQNAPVCNNAPVRLVKNPYASKAFYTSAGTGEQAQGTGREQIIATASEPRTIGFQLKPAQQNVGTGEQVQGTGYCTPDPAGTGNREQGTGREQAIDITGNRREQVGNITGNRREQVGDISGNREQVDHNWLSRTREQGNREQGTGREQAAIHNREQAGTGWQHNREQAGTGWQHNREQGTGNREQAGNRPYTPMQQREQGTGNREQGTGNREQDGKISLATLTEQQAMDLMATIYRKHGNLSRSIVSLYVTGKAAAISESIKKYINKA